MKKLLVIGVLVFIGTYWYLFSPKASAQSPTPQATSPAVQQLREKVKEIVREKIEEVKMGQKRAFFGEISKISGSVITITNPRGERQIKVSEDTKIISKGRKEIKLENLKIGNFIIAMGYLGNNNVLEAKRIVVAEKPKLPAREVAFGKVTDISTEEKILTVKNEKKDITYTVVVTEKTIITKKGEIRIERVNFSAIEKGNRVVAIGTPSENETKLITAKIIHVIPGKAIGLEKEITPTPKLTPTPTPAE
jgi:hypothetical protein